MVQISKLLEEHALLSAQLRRLSVMIASHAPPMWESLHALRDELSSTLIRHLKSEDWIVYPRLLDSPDAAVVETARNFSHEMGNLAATFLDYVEKWGASAIERDWDGFRHDAALIVDALNQSHHPREQRTLPVDHPASQGSLTAAPAGPVRSREPAYPRAKARQARTLAAGRSRRR